MIRFKNKQSSVVHFGPGEKVACLDCRSQDCYLPWYSIADIPLMQIHTLLPWLMLYDTLSLEPLKRLIQN